MLTARRTTMVGLGCSLYRLNTEVSTLALPQYRRGRGVDEESKEQIAITFLQIGIVHE
jgi:hypothetical protein